MGEEKKRGERGPKGTFVGDRDSGCVECIQVSNLGRLGMVMAKAKAMAMAMRASQAFG